MNFMTDALMRDIIECARINICVTYVLLPAYALLCVILVVLLLCDSTDIIRHYSACLVVLF